MPKYKQVESIEVQSNEESISYGEGVGTITLTLPVSEIQVKIQKPTTKIMIEVERLIKRNHRDAGQLEQALVTLSKLICKFGEENHVPYSVLETLELEDIIELNKASEAFFRSF